MDMDMKAAVIYYSLEGNMDYIAKKIAEKHSVDLIRLVPQKAYPTGKISKYIWGGKSVTLGERPELSNGPLSLEQYDTIIFGSPVWASSYAPPLNTLFHDYEIKGKKLILVATHAGGGGKKTFAKMEQYLEGNEILDRIDFVDPHSKKDGSEAEKLSRISQYLG